MSPAPRKPKIVSAATKPKSAAAPAPKAKKPKAGAQPKPKRLAKAVEVAAAAAAQLPQAPETMPDVKPTAANLSRTVSNRKADTGEAAAKSTAKPKAAKPKRSAKSRSIPAEAIDNASPSPDGGKPQKTVKPAAKARPRRPKPKPVLDARRLADLYHAVVGALEEAADPQVMLQIDPIKPGVAVLRRATSDRTWLKVCDGDWTEAEVEAMIKEQLVKVDARSKLGYHVYADEERLARFAERLAPLG